MSASPTAGNVLILCHDCTAGGPSQIAGGGVGQWILCSTSLPLDDNSEVWAGVVDGVPSTQVVVTLGGSPNSTGAVLSEWRGLATPLVFTGAATIGAEGTPADPAVSASLFAEANDLVIATVGVHSGDGETITPASNDGFTALAQPVPTISNVMLASYLVTGAAGTYSTSWVFGFRHEWASAAVSFRASAPDTMGPLALAQQTANSCVARARLDLALAEAPTAGNSIVVCVDSTSRRSVGLSGGGVTNWTLCQSTLSVTRCLFWRRPNVQIWAGVVDATAPAQQIRIAFADGANYGSAVASEWHGLGSHVDCDGRSTIGFGGGCFGPATTGSVAAGAGDLVIAAVSPTFGWTQIGAPANGFTDLARPQTRLFSTMAASYLLPEASGPVTTRWSLSSPDAFGSCIVVFRP